MVEDESIERDDLDNDDEEEDEYDEYAEDPFELAVQQLQIQEEDAIVDEVEDEDTLVNEEMMSTSIGKNDAKKLKELIGAVEVLRSQPLLPPTKTS